MPGDPDRLGTFIDVVTVENSQPLEARYTSYTSLLCKPRDQGRQGTSIYVVTLETSCHGKARHTHCVCVCVHYTVMLVLWTLYVVTAET